MKNFTLLLPFILGPWLGAALTGCAPVLPQSYRPELPALPAAWEEVLGPPWWRIEWWDSAGCFRRVEVEDTPPALDLAAERTVPVLAYPYWPGRGIRSADMRPSGAVFPFDAEGDRLVFTWEGGVAASFYLALDTAARAALIADPEKGMPLRRGETFDWPRFRELLKSGDIHAAIREDPWLADWQSAAERTVKSGFDRRRLVPQKREELSLPVPSGGPWIGSSPFAGILDWKAGETARVGATAGVDAYISPQGILRCTRGVWSWIPH